MADESKVDARIEEELERLQGFDKRRAKKWKDKAKVLAIYMVRREVTSRNLLSNARAIAHLFNEREGSKNVSDDMIRSISALTSLYAWKELEEGVKETVRGLIAEQPEGMRKIAGVLHSTRQAELERRDADGNENIVADYNGLKGYVPSTVAEGSSVIVAEDTDHEYLVRRGYVRIGKYEGDPKEWNRAPMSYYQSSVAGLSPYRQGIAQTVHETWQGVDARTGMKAGPETQGLIGGKRAERLAANVLSSKDVDGLPPGDYLLPIFDADGNVKGYQRPLDPKKLEGLQRDTHLGRMLGVWNGRT